MISSNWPYPSPRPLEPGSRATAQRFVGATGQFSDLRASLDPGSSTGAIRKVRWRRQGMGKRGGARVIYFYHDLHMLLFVILVYAKAQLEEMTADERKLVRALATTLKQGYGRKG